MRHPSVSCGELPAGFSPLLRPDATVVLGDLSGTREVPELVGRIACHAAATGMPVRLVLEVPSREAPRIDAFVRSRGDFEDRLELIRGAFWLHATAVSASAAMLALLERVRECRASGLAIDVVPARDWTHVRAHGDAFELVLVDPRRAHADADVSLVVVAAGGTRFLCGKARCGVRRIPGEGDGFEPRVRWHDVPRGWDGVFYVGAVSASPPVLEPTPGEDFDNDARM